MDTNLRGLHLGCRHAVPLMHDGPANLKPKAHAEFTRRFGNRGMLGHRFPQPLEVAGKPIDIACLAVYLAADESRFATGQEITVDGGLTTCMAKTPRDDLRDKDDRIFAEMQRESRPGNRGSGGDRHG